MADGDNKEKTTNDRAKQWGSTIGNIVKVLKYFKNPIVCYIAIGIVIILLAVGVISYFLAIPGAVLGKISKFFDSIFSSVNKLYVSDSDIKDLCNYLEEMGYDLEAYGFVEEITRSGEYTYQDEEFNNNQPTRGTIESVKSKYLRAYLMAEKKSYLIANNENYNFGERILRLLTNAGETEVATFESNCLDIATEKIFDQIWPVTGQIPETIEKGLQKMYDHNGDKYVIKETYYNEIKSRTDRWLWLPTERLEEYVTYKEFYETEKREKIKEIICAGLKYSDVYEQSLDSMDTAYYIKLITNHKLAIDFSVPEKIQEVSRYLYGKQLIELLDNKTELEQLRDIYYSITLSEQDNGTGLIFLEKNTNENVNSDGTWQYKDGTKHSVEVNKTGRVFIVKTKLQSDSSFFKQLFGNETEYYYDLNGWTTKYGKPVEFLIAVHAATMAPDFAYKLATEGAVDAKVHVDLFPVDMKIQLVTDEEGKTSALDVLDGIDNEESIISYCKNVLSEAYDELLGHAEANSPQWNYINNRKEEMLAANSLKSLIEIVKENTPTYMSGFNIYSAYDSIKNVTIRFVTGKSYTIDELFGDGQIYDKIKEWEESAVSTATPYITKVVNHWFRNNYFTGIDDEDMKNSIARIEEMIDNVQSIASINIEPEDESIEALKSNVEAATNDKEKQTLVYDYITKITNDWLGTQNSQGKREGGHLESAGLDEETKQKVENEIIAAYREVTYGISGGAYTVQANENLDPVVYSVKGVMDRGGLSGYSDTVKGFLEDLYIKELRQVDMVQIYNPLFEDNSRYIRSWLKDKYYIYNGETNNNSNVEGGKTTGVALTDEKLIAGKQFIDGAKALKEIEAEIEKCDSRSDMVYMLRDLKQLFEDFEFDLENQNIPAEKVLDNVFPNYKPYTSWPSVYEKSESDCTKMIWKGGGGDLVAPANCTVDAVGTDSNGKQFIQLKFTDDDEEGTTVADMILRIKADVGTITPGVSEGQIVERGKTIGSVNPGTFIFGEGEDEETSDSMVVLKLNLFTATKQLVRVEDYMTVENKTYDELGTEANLLKGLLASEFEGNSSDTARQAEYIATLNTVFNKILSPYTKNASNIADVLNNAEYHGYLKYNSGSAGDNAIITSTIKNVLSGIDITKEQTLIGATGYYGATETQEDGTYEDRKN